MIMRRNELVKSYIIGSPEAQRDSSLGRTVNWSLSCEPSERTVLPRGRFVDPDNRDKPLCQFFLRNCVPPPQMCVLNCFFTIYTMRIRSTFI